MGASFVAQRFRTRSSAGPPLLRASFFFSFFFSLFAFESAFILLLFRPPRNFNDRSRSRAVASNFFLDQNRGGLLSVRFMTMTTHTFSLFLSRPLFSACESCLLGLRGIPTDAGIVSFNFKDAHNSSCHSRESILSRGVACDPTKVTEFANFGTYPGESFRAKLIVTANGQ